MNAKESTKKLSGRVRHFFRDPGPGLITGATDDDPSGISTYSIAGASFGYLTLWTALFSSAYGCRAVDVRAPWPGYRTRIGKCRPNLLFTAVLWSACALLIVANVFNIGADLGGMAEASEMITGITSYYWTPVYTLVIIFLLFFFHTDISLEC